MTSARTFCSATLKLQFTSLNSGAEHITGNNSENIVLMHFNMIQPPGSINIDHDNDAENIADNIDNYDVIYEPVREGLLNEFVNSSSEPEEKHDRPTSSKCRKISTPYWKASFKII